MTNDKFCNVLDYSEKNWSDYKSYGELVELKLKFDLKCGYRLYDIFDEESIIKENCFFYVTITLPENQWLYDVLMSFGGKVTILRPEKIKNKIIKQYKNAIQQYE